jgi:membrane dipeptidase
MSEPSNLVIDLHEDVAEYYITEAVENDISKDFPGRQADFPKYVKAGVGIVVTSIFPLARTWNPRLSDQLSAGYGKRFPAYTARGPTGFALEQMKVYYQMAKTFPGSFQIIQERYDLEETVKSRRLGFLICMEGTEALEDRSDIEVLYRLGVRGVGFTWNFDTRFAASCMSKKDYGLTGEGEGLVEEANERGIILDLAHSSKRTMMDTLALSRSPVMISHANYSGVHQHTRNVDDDVLERLSKNHGVIGFTMITSTIGPNGGVDGLAKHIIAVREQYGSDILAIGTDYLGITETPAGLEDVTKLKDLFERLAALGMSEDELRKLAWKNAYRIIEHNSQSWALGDIEH